MTQNRPERRSKKNTYTGKDSKRRQKQDFRRGKAKRAVSSKRSGQQTSKQKTAFRGSVKKKVANDLFTLQEEGPIDRLEGRNPIKEALRAGRDINKIWIKKRSKGRTDRNLDQLVHECHRAGAVIIEVEADVLNSMATSFGHQGIIAQVAAHKYSSLQDLLARGEEQKRKNLYPLLILLDGLEESYNLGSILRIADTAGATGVIIPKRRSVALDALVAKASAGAIEYVPVARVVNLSSTIQELKDRGYWIYGADVEGTTTPENSDWLRSIALVIGNEGKGMSAKIKESCDHLIRIPQYGQVNSLNAAVACGILAYEARRQARSEGKVFVDNTDKLNL
ncbi:MAG TPA: 23S rRNA (guanosine(2251)-2'-O)-methyltransferase RlmB [Clostridiaceae bacterium]|nr:23S rRNA (guanosine(2251)-2'-O)-methyltransferase RlmB [Clostridiaceae bacterium]